MRWTTIAAVAVIAAIVGGGAGSAVTLLWRDRDGPPPRGQVVRVVNPGPDPAQTPWCNDLHHFCLVEPSPGQYVALYTYDTHPSFREQGCTVRWDTSLEYTDPTTKEPRIGWFFTGCSGSMFDMSGHRVFGPAPRDLDRFQLTVNGNEFLVDTRRLICGDSPAPQPCERAPAPQ